MIKILCLHIAGNQASYRYRVAQFLPYWKDYDIDMYAIPIVGKNYYEKLILSLKSRQFDYVWLQRKPLSAIFTTLISQRSRLLYDYDDALYAVESYLQHKPKPVQPGSPQSINRLNSVLKHSSIVFAGSEALADYSSKFNIENTFIVPTAYEKIPDSSSCPRAENVVTVGWIGNTGNLFFLSLIDEATAAIQARFPFVRFSVMSGKPPEGLKTRWEFVPWSNKTENSWLQSIDIGIMPLVDDEWSRGKCAFKLLQYMAHCKPVVASAVGANLSTVIDGKSGFLASTSQQWESTLEALVTRTELRESMGKESLKHFLAKFERQKVQEQMAAILHNDFKKSTHLRDSRR
jgi:glycosyltransferase involved in cell wall biosynthesis